MRSSGFRHFAFPAEVYAILSHISQYEEIETFCKRRKMLLQRERQLFLRQHQFFLCEHRLLQPRVGLLRLLSIDNLKAVHYKLSRNKLRTTS